MSSRPCRVVTRAARLAPLLLALTLLLALAPAALAAPPEPTMDLEQLGAALESGPLDGYMLTTMSGTAPEEIPLQVQSIVDYSWGSLILFEAGGPKIEEIGGVAAGMSGSPVYVDHGGFNKLVGAVSYGDMFTLGGMALATPIEYMAAIETDFPIEPLTTLVSPRPPKAGVYELASPVRTSEGVVRSVVVARSVESARTVDAAGGQTVMAPLGILEIGGARPGSRTFERIAARFAKSGLLVKAAAGSGEWDGAPAPALEGGSPCAVLFSQGAVWVGAAGTVTYVDDDTAMLFGHPFEQLGAIDAVLTGGYVQGVWQSSLEPYKIIAPRDVKGACVQDRSWGVEAQIGREPGLFPVSTTVNDADRSVSAHDDSSVVEWLVSSDTWPTLPGTIVGEVAYETLDQYYYPGSAATTTTVVVSDGPDTYTVQHDNLWSDSYDVSYLAGRDAGSIVSRLVADPDGVLQPRIDSVSVETTVSSAQRSARIAGVDLPDGIKIGDNTVRVTYYRYGSRDAETVDATLTIPTGTPLYGRLTVTPATWDQWGGSWCSDSCCEFDGASPTDGPPQTLEDVVDELNALPQNSDLVVSYLPRGSGEDSDSPEESAEIAATIPTDYVFDSYFTATTASVLLRAQPGKVPYGGAVQVVGMVESAGDVSVGIYRQNADADEAVLVQTVTAVASQGAATFQAVVPGLKKNARIIARTGPVEGSLPGSASAPVKVSARVWLSGTDPLVVHVRPSAAAGKTRLQRRSGGRWVDFKTVNVKDGKGAVRLPKGTHVLRARFPGGKISAAGVSRAYTIRVK